MKTSLKAGGFALAALLLVPQAGAAATICMSPASNPGSCANHTFAAAVLLAHPGDTIKLAAGVYYENGVIPPLLDGLQIIGAGKTSTIIDSGNNTLLGITTHTNPGILVASRNVAVKGLTVRNGRYGIVSVANGTVVTGVNIIGIQQYGVYLLGAFGATVSTSEFDDDNIAIASLVTGAVITKNTITNSFFGVAAQGSGTQITSNKVSNTYYGVYALGANGAIVKGNSMSYGAVGVVTDGAFPTVQVNKINGTIVGAESLCTPCFGGSIGQNIVTDSQFAGLIAVSDAPGLQLTANTVTRAGVGILVEPSTTTTGAIVSLNKVADTGNAWSTLDVDGNPGDPFAGHCYAGMGDDSIFLKNSAQRCGGSGLYVNGNNNTLDSNVITSTYENGITIDGCNFHDPSTSPACNGSPFSGNYLTKNKSTGNAGQGIAIVFDAASTVVQFNVASGNRKLPPAGATSLDFCDTGYVGTSLLSNSFADPGGGVTCQVMH